MDPDPPELPTELLHRIHGYLETRDQLTWARLSKGWDRAVYFRETHIVCIEPFRRNYFGRIREIEFEGYKCLVIETWSHLLGVIKRHPNMTHLKLREIHFEGAVASANVMQDIAAEIEYREDDENNVAPLQSFVIERCRAIQVMHFDAINRFRHLREFVWDAFGTVENVMTLSVNRVLERNRTTLTRLGLTTDVEMNLEITILSALSDCTYEIVLPAERRTFWNSFIYRSRNTLTKLVATVWRERVLEDIRECVNLTYLVLHLPLENPWMPLEFGIDVQRLRVLSLRFSDNEDFINPEFGRFLHLFPEAQNQNLEILDIDVPLENAAHLDVICLSCPNLRLLKVPIEYAMTYGNSVSITNLHRLRQLSLVIRHARGGNIYENHLAAIIGSPHLPDLRAILVPRVHFPLQAQARVNQKAEETPGELFFFRLGWDIQLIGPGHPRVFPCAYPDDNRLPIHFFEPRIMVQHDYFLWERITPDYFAPVGPPADFSEFFKIKLQQMQQ